MLECGVFEDGISTVLMQGSCTIAFENRKSLSHELSYYIYDKEILAIMHALVKFRLFLVDSRFWVKTNHHGL